VTAINETKVTLLGSVDNAAHAFVADEDTTFRKRREPITLADVHVGDMVRVEGAVKEGIFVAASVAVMVMPQGGTPTVPREAAPASQPK
jgi:archaellin